MKPDKTATCQLCNREESLTFHHLVPKRFHEDRKVQKLHHDKNLIFYGIWCCKDCHKAIHRRIPLKELAFKFYTLHSLLEHKELARFFSWASKQRKRIKS